MWEPYGCLIRRARWSSRSRCSCGTCRRSGGPLRHATFVRHGSAALVPVPVGDRGAVGSGDPGRGPRLLPLDPDQRQAGTGAAPWSPGSPEPGDGKTRPGNKYAATTRGHSESVLRGFYEFHREAGSGPMVNPFPLARRRRPGARPPQSDGASTATSGRGCIGRGMSSGCRAVSRTRSSTSCSPSLVRIATGPWSPSGCPRARGRRSCSGCRHARRRPGSAADHGGSQGHTGGPAGAGLAGRVRVVAAVSGTDARPGPG